MFDADSPPQPHLSVHPTAWSRTKLLYRRLAIAIALVPVVAISAGLTNLSATWWVVVASAIVVGAYQMFRVGIMPRDILRLEKRERAAGYTTMRGLWRREPNVYLLNAKDGSVIQLPLK